MDAKFLDKLQSVRSFDSYDAIAAANPTAITMLCDLMWYGSVATWRFPCDESTENAIQLLLKIGMVTIDYQFRYEHLLAV
jgi:hypothetical protein